MIRLYHILLAATLLLAGCNTIYEYPDDNPVDPNAVAVSLTVELELDLDLDFDLTQEFSTRSSALGEPLQGHKLRVIVEAYPDKYPGSDQIDPDIYNTEPEARSEMVFDNIGEIAESIPVELKLSAHPYIMLVWADYLPQDGSVSGYYDASALHSIRFVEPYNGNTRGRDAFCCHKRIDLTSYAGEKSVTLSEEFTMSRPLARYELTTTDIKKFFVQQTKSSQSWEVSQLSDYTVKVSYRGYFPAGFDAITDKPSDARTGIEFDASFTDVTDTSAVIALDYVLADTAATFVVADIRIYDENGKLINESSGIQIPYRRNNITKVYGEFLTKSYGSGVSVNPDFNGEFNVYL